MNFPLSDYFHCIYYHSLSAFCFLNLIHSVLKLTDIQAFPIDCN